MKRHKPGLRAAGTHPTPIGYRASGTPIFLAAGGSGVSVAPDDDAAERELFGERDDEDGDPDGDDPDDGEDPGYEPPDQTTWEQMQRDLAAQRASNSQGGRLARMLRDNDIDMSEVYAKLGIDPKSGKKADPADDPADEPEPQPANQPERDGARVPSKAEIDKVVADAVAKSVEREVAKATATTEKRFKAPLKTLAVRAALADAEWSGKDLTRVLKMIDDDEIEVTDDGDVVGVVEQIESIKEEFPEWFQGRRRQAPQPRRAADIDGGERRAPAKQLSWKERAAARLDGKRG